MLLNLTLLESDFERALAHEAGHAVVGLSLGAFIEHIERASASGMPGSLMSQGFDEGLCVQFEPTIKTFEPRFQYTVAAAGMAAERLVFGRFEPIAASHDVDLLRAAGRTDIEILGLIDIAQKVLSENVSFLDFVRQSLKNRPSWLGPILVDGSILNERFRSEGVKVDISVDLEKLLPG